MTFQSLSRNALLCVSALCGSIYAYDWREQAETSVVFIEAAAADATSYGTGFVWPDEYHVVTAYHVVAGASRILIRSDVIKPYRAVRLTRVLNDADLALLRVDENGPLPASPVSLTSSAIAAQTGESLVCLGHGLTTPALKHIPLTVSRASEILERVVSPDTLDEIRKFNLLNDKIHVISLDGNLVPGHSGAPIFRVDGRVAGIGSGGEGRGSFGIGWAVPVSPWLEYLWVSEDIVLRQIPRKARSILWADAGPMDVATANEAEALKWREILLARYRLYLGRGIAEPEIDRVIRVLQRCDLLTARRLVGEFSPELMSVRRYEDGLKDYRDLLGRAHDLVKSNRSEQMTRISPQEFTVRIYTAVVSAGHKKTLDVVVTRLRGEGFTVHLVDLHRRRGISVEERIKMYVGDISVSDLPVPLRPQVVYYPPEANPIIELIQRHFSETKSHQYVQRSRSSKQYQIEGASLDAIIDIIGLPTGMR